MECGTGRLVRYLGEINQEVVIPWLLEENGVGCARNPPTASCRLALEFVKIIEGNHSEDLDRFCRPSLGSPSWASGRVRFLCYWVAVITTRLLRNLIFIANVRSNLAEDACGFDGRGGVYEHSATAKYVLVEGERRRPEDPEKVRKVDCGVCFQYPHI